MTTDIVILAAGQGSRMKSNCAKVLHQIAAKPLLQYVLDSAQSIDESEVYVVIGHQAEQLQTYLENRQIHCVLQQEQRGTGHAVQHALPHCSDDSIVLILYGDVPFTPAPLLQGLVQVAKNNVLSLLTVTVDNPAGYGRIIRDANNQVCAIVEHKDANEEQRNINEVNTGILAVKKSYLNQWIPKLSANNAQGEYYLTDIIAMAVKDGISITTFAPEYEQQVQGVNNRVQLAELERWYQKQQAIHIMEQGASILDPSRFDIRGELQVGKDVIIDINCIFEGQVTLGDHVFIGANCILKNCHIDAHTRIEANSIIEGAVIASHAVIGPFARIRPETNIASSAKIGNFVEIKKSNIGVGSKVNHLSYIGDTEIGTGVNVGAGTITCNYDGVNKYKTEIRDHAFIGSNTALVAPVCIEASATVAAGSTITKNVPEGQLGIARSKQQQLPNWKRPTKKTD